MCRSEVEKKQTICVEKRGDFTVMCTPTSEGRTGRVTPSAALMCMHIVFVVARPTDASSMNGLLADC